MWTSHVLPPGFTPSPFPHQPNSRLCPQGKEVAHVLETNGVIHFPDPYIEGFGWDPDGGFCEDLHWRLGIRLY